MFVRDLELNPTNDKNNSLDILKSTKSYCQFNNENFNLLSLDNEGKLQWAKSYGEIYWGYDQNEKGEILLSGHTRKTPLSKNLDIQIKKLNHTGEEVWTKFFGQPRGYDGKWIHDEVWGVRSTPDDGWLAVAGTGDETRRYEGRGHPSGPSGQWKVYLIKTYL